MKTLVFMFLAISPIVLHAQKLRDLNIVLELEMPRTKKDINYGTNGAAVAYNPSQKKYYATFAGNAKYPLAVFNTKGKRISSKKLNCMVDIRGLWYNRKTSMVCGRAHAKKKWFNYKLSANGIPTGKEFYLSTRTKIANQQMAAYNAKKDLVYFLQGQFIKVYNREGFEEKSKALRLYPGITDKGDIDDTNAGKTLGRTYNSNVLIYTGIKKAEFGILNYQKKQIELYNKKNGLLTRVLKLPKNTQTYKRFNFSYADGLFWLYNQTTRTWIGYE